MDGSLRVPVITRGGPFPNLRHPNDVAIDLNTDMVYFSDSSAGIIGVATLSGNGGRVIVNKMSDNPQLRRSQPTTDYIRKPRSLSIRHLASVHQDNDDDTEESELFWSDPDFNTISVTDLVTTGRRTMGIEKSRLRLLLSKATAYKTYAVQFVSRNGHKDGGEIDCHAKTGPTYNRSTLTTYGPL